MEISKFKELIEANKSTLSTLESDSKFIVGSLGLSKLLLNEDALEDNAELFAEGADKAFSTLITSDFLKNYPTTILIDFSKAVSLYLGSDMNEDEKISTAIMMSRVNFMGTDGIRGKVVLETKENFIADLLADNAVSPALVSTTSFSFAKMLLDNELVKAGDTIVIGNDGRDLAYDWKLNDAVKDGFNRAGLNVLDTGIVPTAIIPWKMLQLGHSGGACLTASHNPSNQNGIKFFIEGAKLLPEGPLGDYVLSANMFNYCMLEEMPEPTGTSSELANVIDDSVQWMIDVLPENMEEALKDTILVFDSANGATDIIGRKVLEKLGANYTSRNETPSGDNINRSCGVAEIEGTELFKGTAYDSHIPFVQEIFDLGRKNEAGKVFGIPLDGDGDRGFLMYYDKKADDVHVLDGDKCGYILSEYLVKEKGVNPKDYWFISTIESDIMTANEAEKNLGLNKKVVSVGDKWIGNFTEGEVLVGLEISGHLIFPIKVKDQNGNEKTLLSGVGLLTGMVALAAIKSLKLSEERIIEPFTPGFSKTFYTFFVDKTKFYRESAIWNEDKALIESEVKSLIADGKLPKDTTLTVEDKEDPHVLYINFISNGELLGVIFTRNSGTEDKNAVYVKGQQSVEKTLIAIGSKLQNLATEKMKNENRIEYSYEKVVMTLLDSGDTTVALALEAIRASGLEVTETDLFSVIYGLKKEGRVELLGSDIKKR